jgi:RNA polymerase sigma-70 factor (ECF subfamily)
MRFGQPSARSQFEREILPHLDAAYSLARFLLRNDQEAEDVVQESALRAFRFFESFRGDNSRAWFLRIVRNTAFTAMKRLHGYESHVAFDEAVHTPESAPNETAAAQLDSTYDSQAVRAAIEQLPPEFREVITLRELEDLSYKQIADITNTPIGTVMSRLARARTQLGQILSRTFNRGS